MSHMIAKLVTTAFFFLCISSEGALVQVPFKVIDESGDSPLKVSLFSDNGKNKFIVSRGSEQLVYTTKHSYESAFLSGSKEDRFVWLIPLQNLGENVAV